MLPTSEDASSHGKVAPVVWCRNPRAHPRLQGFALARPGYYLTVTVGYFEVSWPIIFGHLAFRVGALGLKGHAIRRSGIRGLGA